MREYLLTVDSSGRPLSSDEFWAERRRVYQQADQAVMALAWDLQDLALGCNPKRRDHLKGKNILGPVHYNQAVALASGRESADKLRALLEWAVAARHN